MGALRSLRRFRRTQPEWDRHMANLPVATLHFFGGEHVYRLAEKPTHYKVILIHCGNWLDSVFDLEYLQMMLCQVVADVEPV